MHEYPALDFALGDDVDMGTLGTAVAFVWFLEGVKALGPARAAIFVNLVPVAAITLAVLLLGEHVTGAMIELRWMRSFLATAMIATLKGLPASLRRR